MENKLNDVINNKLHFDFEEQEVIEGTIDILNDILETGAYYFGDEEEWLGEKMAKQLWTTLDFLNLLNNKIS